MKSGLRIVLAFSALLCCANLYAQVIVPTQTDEIIIDNGTSGKADPNDRIRYKVTIQNTGAASGTGVQLNVVPDPRTIFVPGSFRSSPLAVPDVYACTGNVGITLSAASGLKANDFDDNIAGASVTAGTFATTGGGAITIAADGSFTYNPLAGFVGSDTYSYTLNDGNGVGGGVPATDMGTVTFTVSNIIWFVDNTAGGTGGAGSLSSPFRTLGDFNGSAGPQNGQVVFVKNTGTKYNGGIVLKNNMYLFGTGHSGGSNLADVGVLPFTMAANSNALPAINSTKPIIISPVNGITLASGNTIRGVEVGPCFTGSKIIGTGFGTLTIGNTTSPDVVLNGNRQALNLTNGAFAASSKFASISCLDTSSIVLNNVSGTLASGSTTVNAQLSAKAIDIQNSSAAIDFGPTIANQFGGGTAISITNSATGSVTFSSLSIPNAANGVGLIANAGGTINIGGTSSAITARTALDITSTSFGSGATFASITSLNSGGKGVNLDAVTGAVVINGGSITNSTGIAFDINAGSSTITYAGSISNANRAVEITGRTGGTVTFSGNITNTGTGINVSSNTGGIMAFSGSSKSLTTGANTAVTLASNTGATINFANGGLVINTTSGTGFSATGGGTVTVGTGSSNNMITTTAAKAVNLDGVFANVNFATISAGSVPTEGINLNNLTTSSSFVVPGTVTLGMAAGSNANVNISGCTNCTIDIGTNGTTHNSVNLNSRRASGIVLNNASGTIRLGNVTASNPNSVTVPAIKSTTCAGSIFFAKTDVDMNLAGSNEGFTNAETPQDNNGDGDAIYINNFTGTAFTINGGTIENAGDDGIDIRNSKNLSLSNIITEDVGKSAGATCVDCNSSGVQAYNLTGTNTITNCSFQRGRLRNFYLSNSTGTATLNISGSTFNDTRISGSPATDNLQVYGTSSASVALDIESSFFTRSSTKQIDVVFKDNAQLTKCDITGCTVDYVDGNSAGIFIEGFDNAQVNFNIMNNPKLHSQNENVVTISSSNAANVQGRIKDNSNMKYNGTSNGGSIFSGIRVLSDGTTSVATVLIENNSLEIVNCDFGINLAVQGSNSAVINGAVNANVITATGVTHLEGILAVVNNTPGVGKLICLTINNNQVSGAALARVCRARALSASGVRITNYVTDLTTTWNNNGNTGAPVAEGSSGGGSISAAIIPCALPTNPLP